MNFIQDTQQLLLTILLGIGHRLRLLLYFVLFGHDLLIQSFFEFKIFGEHILQGQLCIFSGYYLFSLLCFLLPSLNQHVAVLDLLLEGKLVQGYRNPIYLIISKRSMRLKVGVQLLFELQFSCVDVRVVREVDQDVIVVLLVLLSGAGIEVVIDEKDLFEVDQIDYYMASLNQIFTYTFEEFPSFAAPVDLQVEQMFIQLALDPQKHPLLMAILCALIIWYQVSELLPKGRAQNRVSFLIFFLLSWLVLFVVGLLSGGGLNFFAGGSDGVDILILIVEVHHFAFSFVLLSVLVVLEVALWVVVRFGGNQVHFLTRINSCWRVVQIHRSNAKIYTHLIQNKKLPGLTSHHFTIKYTFIILYITTTQKQTYHQSVLDSSMMSHSNLALIYYLSFPSQPRTYHLPDPFPHPYPPLLNRLHPICFHNAPRPKQFSKLTKNLNDSSRISRQNEKQVQIFRDLEEGIIK